MKLPIAHEFPARRRRVVSCIIIFLTLASLEIIPGAPGQTAQSLTLNRALVSSGPQAVPPTKASPPSLSALDPVMGSIGIARAPLPEIKLFSNQGIFDLVGVNPDQLVQVTITYPALAVGRLITAEALDGGQVISATPLVVGPDQTIRFQFRAAHTPGFNHIALHNGARETGLQFWVLDAQHPERKPAVINP